ncbi:LuxR family transcriptional regulator [Serratia marcescens]|uniref:LuxR C-terminal-related transcriptional regulator n=2 Tax=Serratia TaxID=613 RepID=UPI000B5DEB1F|nr:MULTISPECIES: LuxR C-terminal-related transcriptional regulator [Serratia]MBH3319508.1 LuxR family transcriptional regulator [Serratia ureilytica]ASM15423.1 LuxR family transcriptional regulator [Serratia marcescens]MBH2789677.1 LuxR family transcriptional regulator [Serratia marcescens]MBH3278716.1 LuxR family transcriptional regulator [Serratia marcescens]MBI6198900.1 LuxR family transcriptional regulator [Serratia marcescens]
MKKIILFSQCQFMYLALKTVFENKTDYTMEYLSSGYRIDKECANTTILIHVTAENYSDLLVLMRSRQFFWLRKAIFITQKRLAALMSYLSMKTLRFIDESASVEAFEREIVEGGGSESDAEKGELLSQAEYTVLRFAASGMSLTAIAFRTRKSIKTISSQKISGLRKMGLENTPHSLLNLFNLFY